MFTQQEVIENSKLYETFKDKQILFSTPVSKSIGLKQQGTLIKIGFETSKAAIVSSSMTDMVVLANIDEQMQKKIYSTNGIVTVQLRFYDSLFKKELTFNLQTKFLNMNNHGLIQKDIHYMSLQFKRKLPNDLIKVFGKHHKKIETATSKKKNSLEGILFSRGIKKMCTPVGIDNDSIILKSHDNPSPFLSQKAMVVLKSIETDEVFEVIGRINEVYSQENNTYQLRLDYSMDQQSPPFQSIYFNTIQKFPFENCLIE